MCTTWQGTQRPKTMTSECGRSYYLPSSTCGEFAPYSSNCHASRVSCNCHIRVRSIFIQASPQFGGYPIYDALSTPAARAAPHGRRYVMIKSLAFSTLFIPLKSQGLKGSLTEAVFFLLSRCFDTFGKEGEGRLVLSPFVCVCP